MIPRPDAYSYPILEIGMTFADAVNGGLDLAAEVRKRLDETNEVCKRHPHSPRDAGVVDPHLFVEKPLSLVKVDLIDGDTGVIVVDSFWGVREVHFSAEDDIDEFCQMDLMEVLH